MSWVRWARAYRPTKKGVAFTSTGVCLYSLYRYDRLEAKRIHDGFLEEARAIGDEPLPVDAFTPRALLYVAPGPLMFRHALAFTDYVRPIWMAAGMRCEVVEHRYHQDLYHHLLEKQKDVKRIRAARADLIARREAEAKQMGRDWLGRKKPLPEPTEEEARLLSLKPEEDLGWDKDVRIVTMGRSAFRVTLRALQDGMSPNEEVPPLGFIPYTPRTWLWRLIRFFNTREDTYVLGKAAVIVARDAQMNMARVFGGALQLEGETLQDRKDSEGSLLDEQPTYGLDEPATIDPETLQRISFLQQREFAEDEE